MLVLIKEMRDRSVPFKFGHIKYFTLWHCIPWNLGHPAPSPTFAANRLAVAPAVPGMTLWYKVVWECSWV